MAMDPMYNLQDVIRCNLCETPMPLLYCEICKTRLCKDCEKKHILGGSTEHKVVPYQIRSRDTSAQKAHLNKSSQQLTSAPKERGEDRHWDTLQSVGKQKINKKKTNRQFGSLSALSVISEERGNTIDLPNVESAPPQRQLIDEPQLITDINTEYVGPKNELSSVACLSDGYSWTCGNDNMMRLYNPQGELLRSIQTKTGNVPEDIAVTKSGKLVYIDISDSSVNIAEGAEIHTVIILQGFTPRSICSTSTGDLLVIMDDGCHNHTKVVRYSSHKETQSFHYSFGQTIKYITENRNLDICVADCGENTVVVFKQSGEFRFKYPVSPFNINHVMPFTPYGITTDSQSRILVADLFNDCIHILDQDGQFLRYIKDRILHMPMGLCIDTNDILFVAENFRGKVKRIQYSKKKTESIGARVARFLGIINRPL